ncbi:MAG: carbonate dehydratase [Methylococcales bacterium]|nr:carbonate dehydratase [Methylococcales bacterium]
MEDIQALFFRKNKAWADKMLAADPEFFIRLHKQQHPKYLWIGCSDSRVSANQVVGLDPGEIFVHRNIANVVVHTDLNCLSVIQYAVEVLNVEHIIVCGHYGCGGVKAAMENQEHGLIDNWLQHIQDVYRTHRAEINALGNANDRYRLLCEKNVIEQVVNVCHTTIIQKAWRKKVNLSIHGWIYSVKNGILHDLGVCISHPDQLSAIYSDHGLSHS